MFRKLDLFPSSGEGGEAPTLLDPLERSNLNHWTTPVRFTKATYLPETRLIRKEITGKYSIKIMIEDAHSWK
jgi:hypothetical protein